MVAVKAEDAPCACARGMKCVCVRACACDGMLACRVSRGAASACRHAVHAAALCSPPSPPKGLSVALLDLDAVRQAIARTYRHILVDEFQVRGCSCARLPLCVHAGVVAKLGLLQS